MSVPGICLLALALAACADVEPGAVSDTPGSRKLEFRVVDAAGAPARGVLLDVFHPGRYALQPAAVREGLRDLR